MQLLFHNPGVAFVFRVYMMKEKNNMQTESCLNILCMFEYEPTDAICSVDEVIATQPCLTAPRRQGRCHEKLSLVSK